MSKTAENIGFTIAQIADGLGCSHDTILRRINAGELPALRFAQTYVVTQQAVIDAIERGLGSKAPADAAAAIAKTQQADAVASAREEARVNPEVDVVIGNDAETGEPITQKMRYPTYDPRSGFQTSPQQVAARAEALAAHNRGEEQEEGDAGRRTVIRTVDGKPRTDVVAGINRGALFDGTGDQGANEMVRAIQQARTSGRSTV